MTSQHRASQLLALDQRLRAAKVPDDERERMLGIASVAMLTDEIEALDRKYRAAPATLAERAPGQTNQETEFERG